jgi:hypothetical protein
VICDTSPLPPCSSNAAALEERNTLITLSHELAVARSNLAEVLEDLGSFLHDHRLDYRQRGLLEGAYEDIVWVERSFEIREQMSVEACQRAGVTHPEHQLCPRFFTRSCEQAPMRVFIDSYVVDVQFGGMGCWNFGAVASFPGGSQRLLGGSRSDVARSVLGIMLQKGRR